MLSIGLLHSCRAADKTAQSSERGAKVFPERLISEESCRNLFQKALQEALSFSPPSPTVYTPDREAALGLLSGLQQLGPQLNEIANGTLASVEKKLSEITYVPSPETSTGLIMGGPMNGPVEEMLQTIQTAPEDVREHLYMQLAMSAAARGDGAGARKIINENISNPIQRRQALANLEQQEMHHSLSQGKVEDALKTISAMRSPRERANMLMQIARQIGPGYKRAAALQLLEQARSLVAPGIQVQDQEQMIALLELVRAFARYDAKRAFEIVDPFIDQFNEMCAAARTLQGFGLEYFKNDELEMISGNNLSSLAAQISSTLATLAISNFERAKATTDRFRLPEVRLRAYLEIAQQTIQAGK